MVTVSIKHHWLAGWVVPPAPAEHIVANQFPMLYLLKPEKAKELISKVENATIKHVARSFPEHLVKAGRACELKSKWG